MRSAAAADPDETAPLERVAVLIDCDSSEQWAGRALDLLMLEIAQWGTAIVRRAFGDVSESRKWRRSLLDHAFTPVLEYSDAKTALVIDTMDLLFDRDIDAFVVVSSSASLARLAMRIRESNRVVIGYGDRAASRDLVVACHRYVYRDNLGIDINVAQTCDVDAAFSSEEGGAPQDGATDDAVLVKSGETTAASADDDVKASKASSSSRTARTSSSSSSSSRSPKRRAGLVVGAGDASRARVTCVSGAQLRKNELLIEMLSKSVRDNSVETGGWAHLSTVGHELQRILPDFDPRDWGYVKLGDLIRATELFDVDAKRGDKRTVQVRVKDDVPFARETTPRRDEKRDAAAALEESSKLSQILDDVLKKDNNPPPPADEEQRRRAEV